MQSVAGGERGGAGSGGRSAYEAAGRVKCFHAGLRWGLTLPRAALGSRSALAKALSAALAPHGAPPVAGEALHVLFMDAAGATRELPPLGGKGGEALHGEERQAREAEAGWREAAKGCVRLYVR